LTKNFCECILLFSKDSYSIFRKNFTQKRLKMTVKKRTTEATIDIAELSKDATPAVVKIENPEQILAVTLAQNQVLLSLINRYFDLQESAIVQGMEFMNRLITEGVDLAKISLENSAARFEISSENTHELALKHAKLEAKKFEADQERSRARTRLEASEMQANRCKTQLERRDFRLKELQVLNDMILNNNSEALQDALKNVLKGFESNQADQTQKASEGCSDVASGFCDPETIQVSETVCEDVAKATSPKVVKVKKTPGTGKRGAGSRSGKSS